MSSTGRLLERWGPEDDPSYVGPPLAPTESTASTPKDKLSRRPLLSPTIEPMKSVLYRDFTGIILWPISAIISVAGTAVLLYLNFTRYSIGGEVGRTTKETANILGALQIAVKLHELFIVASLAAIVQQWVLGDLMVRGGTLFGLLGADLSLADPTFVVSKGYTAALRYGFSVFRSRGQAPEERVGKRRVFLLTIFLFAACVISSLAGPASAVLMVPRIDWFFYQRVERPYNTTMGVLVDAGYPNILITPQYSQGFSNKAAWGGWDYVSTGVQYFGEIGTFMQAWGDDEAATPNNETTHRTYDYVGDVLFNVSTTWDRVLPGVWTGGTTIRTVMRLDVKTNSDYLANNRKKLDSMDWRGRRYVVDMNALESWVVCHSDTKSVCTNSTSNSSEWCYRSPGNHTGRTPLRHSKDLLFVRKQENGINHNNEKGYFYPRVWMTEGTPLKDSPNFSDSIEVVFEGDYSLEMVTACSISTKLKAATATLVDNSLTFNAEQVEYHDYISRSDGTRDKPQTLLFYKGWLDGYAFNGNYTGNFTFPQRSSDKGVSSGPLRGFADSVRPAIDSQGWDEKDKAAILETVVGGAFLHILAWTGPSTSQYAIPEDVILPQDLMPYPRKTYGSLPVVPICTYTEGYGFQLSSRTGYLGVFVLIGHAVIVIFAAAWQLFYRGTVIKAWSSIPEYVALGIGSTARVGVLENTCAGISEKATLGSVVRVGETTMDHLEIVVTAPGLTAYQQPLLGPVKLGKYGSYGGGPRRKEKME